MLSLSDIVNVKVGIGRGVFEAPGATVIGGKKPSFNLEILKLFANGEQGFWYDPNDLSTMYQDAAGIVPVTAQGQPVGLIRDKSGRNNHAYQTVSASRPILRQNAITSAYYLEFDGVDDFMVTAPLNLTGKKELTIHAGVLALPTAKAYEYLLANGNSTSDAGLVRVRLADISTQKFEVNSGTYVAVDGPSAANRPEKRVIFAKFSSSEPYHSFTVNDVTAEKVVQVTKDTTLTTLPMYIGRQASNSWNATMGLYGLTVVSAVTVAAYDKQVTLDYEKRMGI